MRFNKIIEEKELEQMLERSISLFPEMEITDKSKFNHHLPETTDRKAAELWDKCLEFIQDNVDKQVFLTWFKPIRAKKWSDEKLTILVPSQWFYEWIETHYYDLLQKTIEIIIGKDAKLQYEVVVEESKKATESKTILLPGLKYPINNIVKQEKPFNSNLNSRYAFENFVVGDCNQLTYSAAMAVSNAPGETRFNPLFIYGGTGLGKTHIIQAIGNKIVREQPNKKVLYTNSERFTIDFINAIQNNKIHEFAALYRDVDVLIVDDIQFLTGKEKTQDHFFHTFNDLYQSKKQLIFASDRSPKELTDIDARLISRFQWGLIADIHQPDFETRLAIIKRKSEDEGIDIPLNVLEFIAGNVKSSVRELEGALIGLLAKITFDKRELSIDLAKEVIFGSSNFDDGSLISIDEIKKAVSSKLKISIELMESKVRKHEIAFARQMAIFLAKQFTDLSLKQIGAAFGGRDHSTVLHSCQAIDNYLATDRSVRKIYEELVNQLKR